MQIELIKSAYYVKKYGDGPFPATRLDANWLQVTFPDGRKIALHESGARQVDKPAKVG